MTKKCRFPSVESIFEEYKCCDPEKVRRERKFLENYFKNPHYISDDDIYKNFLKPNPFEDGENNTGNISPNEDQSISEYSSFDFEVSTQPSFDSYRSVNDPFSAKIDELKEFVSNIYEKRRGYNRSSYESITPVSSSDFNIKEKLMKMGII